MENDRISYTYSEKISDSSFGSKQISVSLTRDVETNWNDCLNEIKAFVHSSVELEKQKICQAPVPPPNLAPMPSQPVVVTFPPSPVQGGGGNGNPGQEPYVPVAKGIDYVIKCKPHYGKTIKKLQAEGGLQGFYEWCVNTLAGDPGSKSFGIRNFVKQAEPFVEKPLPF